MPRRRMRSQAADMSVGWLDLGPDGGVESARAPARTLNARHTGFPVRSARRGKGRVMEK
jgi:hypothetical protein